MARRPRGIVLATVGISLKSNIEEDGQRAREPEERAIVERLRTAWQRRDWDACAAALHQLDSRARVCGAEINSMRHLVDAGHVRRGQLHLLHSDTADGETLATILQRYFTQDGWNVSLHRIQDLRDDDPVAFSTRGLRSLAREMGAILRASYVEDCAINATGGYKAQVAIAVLLGQALQVPVYYKHERFDRIISFPGMPVALDFKLWLQHNDLFWTLDRAGSGAVPWEPYAPGWDDRLDSLVDREPVDGTEYMALSPTGQIFHEAFKHYFKRFALRLLPPPASRKERPVFREHCMNIPRKPVMGFMQRVTDARNYVVRCRVVYCNPDLPQMATFKYLDKDVMGIYSDGTWCVRFIVDTTAQTEEEKRAVVADLNQWLQESGG